MACRHVEEMKKEGVTENHAIRVLKLLADIYANLLKGGTASPYSAGRVELWSLKARKFKNYKPYGKYVRVEHGTPSTTFARMVLQLYKDNKLNQKEIDNLVNRYWKIAVITLNEDKRLNEIGARSKMFKTPELRWEEAGILF